ncbi:Helo-like-N domain-containing protein [Fusarium keratoplasticum]|nr:Helo-like-N domain-containing protein [Fusarium keratoplasticum]
MKLNRTPLHGTERNPELFHALLDAGADPTIQLDVGFPSLFQEASRRGDPIAGLMLREMFNTSPFVRYGDQADLGTNPVLDCCRNLFKSHHTAWRQGHLQRLGFLLDQGYSLHAKWKDGTNCLSQFFLTSESQGYLESRGYVQVRREILLFLVNRGADVSSTDNKGRSVSYYAYNRVFCTPCSETYPAYLGDLWDSVLDECGYNILEFRRLAPRKARYTNIYTRRVFEQLWRGRERRCPYWNDAPWPESSTDNIPRIWYILDENGKMCEKCQVCYERPVEVYRSNCCKCGFCTTDLGCLCAQSINRGHQYYCTRPLQREIRWDEKEGRYFFPRDEGDGVCSLGMRNGRATSPQEDHLWDNLSPASSRQPESTIEGSQLLEELFENPWERE